MSRVRVTEMGMRARPGLGNDPGCQPSERFTMLYAFSLKIRWAFVS